LSKRGDWDRKWNSFKRHFILLLQPFAFSTVVSLAWWSWLYKNGIHFAKEDESSILTGVFLLLSVAYGITTAITFGSIWEKYQKVVRSVLRHDMQTFLYYRDERIPIIIHLLILSFSFPILGFVGFIEYHTVSAGIASVFSTSFVLSLYWVVITELQNPAKSLWFAERIPKKWLTIDIDKHFKLAEEGTPEQSPCLSMRGLEETLTSLCSHMENTGDLSLINSDPKLAAWWQENRTEYDKVRAARTLDK